MDSPNNYCFLINYGQDYYCILSEFGSGYIYYNEDAKALDFEYMGLDFNKEDFTALLEKYLGE